MMFKFKILFLVCCLAGSCLAKEVFVIEPVEMQRLDVWVVADRPSPQINRSCRPRVGLEYSLSLGADIEHSKIDGCVDGVARVLAEYSWVGFKEDMPLTIFNGWQWEYAYGIAQFAKVDYQLDKRGGCWEGCFDAVLNRGYGKVRAGWITRGSLQIDEAAMSEILITNFSSMRTRNGYPKQHKF